MATHWVSGTEEMLLWKSLGKEKAGKKMSETPANILRYSMCLLQFCHMLPHVVHNPLAERVAFGPLGPITVLAIHRAQLWAAVLHAARNPRVIHGIRTDSSYPHFYADFSWTFSWTCSWNFMKFHDLFDPMTCNLFGCHTFKVSFHMWQGIVHQLQHLQTLPKCQLGGPLTQRCRRCRADHHQFPTLTMCCARPTIRTLKGVHPQSLNPCESAFFMAANLCQSI